MKKKNILIMTVAALSLMSCSERIDAGCEGILVNMYGDDKGVDGVSLCTGRVWYNPFTQEVYEYPTYVQTIDYKPFTINAKDGSEFTVDPTISLKIIDGKSPVVFKKYRKELKDVIEGTLYNHVKFARNRLRPTCCKKCGLRNGTDAYLFTEMSPCYSKI